MVVSRAWPLGVKLPRHTRLLVLNEAHVRRILASHFTYYHESPAHLSLKRYGTTSSRASVRRKGDRHSATRRIASSLSPRGLSSPSGSFALAVRGGSTRVPLKSGDSRAKKPSFRRHSPLLAVRAYANSSLDTSISARTVFSGTTAFQPTNPPVLPVIDGFFSKIPKILQLLRNLG